jgi:hypothetical protein
VATIGVVGGGVPEVIVVGAGPNNDSNAPPGGMTCDGTGDCTTAADGPNASSRNENGDDDDAVVIDVVEGTGDAIDGAAGGIANASDDGGASSNGIIEEVAGGGTGVDGAAVVASLGGGKMIPLLLEGAATISPFDTRALKREFSFVNPMFEVPRDKTRQRE